jgi:hypothetical protein
MRLVDLDPRWLIENGRRVGFIFISPIQHKVKPHPYYQSCFASTVPPRRLGQWPLFKAAFPERKHPPVVQGAREGVLWTIEGEIENATFETMTVSPSIDGSAGGLWHGFIQNGQIVGGI